MLSSTYELESPACRVLQQPFSVAPGPRFTWSAALLTHSATGQLAARRVGLMGIITASWDLILESSLTASKAGFSSRCKPVEPQQ